MKNVDWQGWVRRHWPVGVVIVLLSVFYRSFLEGTAFIWEDGLNSFYPATQYFCSSLVEGRFPLWFPGVNCGMPFYSDPQMLGFYPVTWLMMPFVKDGMLPFVVYQRFLVMQVMLGGVFFYLFLREYRLRSFALALGTLVFCLSGFMSLHFKHVSLDQVYIWLPLILWLVKRLVNEFRPLRLVALLVAISLSLLGGSTQITVYVCYVAIAFWIFCVVMRSREQGHEWKSPALLKKLGCQLALIFVTFGLVGLLNAYLILPAQQNYQRSWRSAWDAYEALDQSLPPYHLVAFLAPNYFGSTEDGGAPMKYWGYDRQCREVQKFSTGYWQYWELGGYTGQLALLAFLCVLFNWRQMRDRKAVLFFAGALVFGLWYAIGRYGGLLNVLVHVMPMISRFRVPARMVMLVDFSAAVLVAFCVDAVQEKLQLKLRWPLGILAALYVAVLVATGAWGGFPEPQTRAYAMSQIWMAAALFAATGICFFAAQSAKEETGRRVALAILIGVCFFDLYNGYSRFHRGKVSPDDYFADRAQLLPQLHAHQKQRGPSRFAQAVDGRLHPGFLYPHGFPFFHPEVEFPKGDTTFNLADISAVNQMNNERSKADLFNVGVLATMSSRTRELGVVFYTNSLPRVKFYSSVQTFSSNTNLLAALEKGKLDYSKTVGILDEDAKRFPEIQNISRPAGTNDWVKYNRQSPEKYTIEYSVSSPGVIFVSEAYYPGWEVNAWNPIIEVFGAFKGIVVTEPGKGTLTVEFHPNIFKVGLLVSGITALGLAVFVLAYRFVKKGAVT